MNINSVQVCGRITKKPEIKTTTGGNSVTSFGVASNRTWNNKAGEKQTEAEFHNITSFGRIAEVICQYFDVGDEIYVQGRLKTNMWQTPEGVKKYKTDIILEKFEFGQKANSPAQSQATQQAPPPQEQPQQVPPQDDINQISDIPF